MNNNNDSMTTITESTGESQTSKSKHEYNDDYDEEYVKQYPHLYLEKCNLLELWY